MRVAGENHSASGSELSLPLYLSRSTTGLTARLLNKHPGIVVPGCFLPSSLALYYVGGLAASTVGAAGVSVDAGAGAEGSADVAGA